MNNSNYEMVSIRNSLYESKLFTIAFEAGTNLDDFLEKYVYQLNLNNHEKVSVGDRIDKLRGEDIVAFTSMKTGDVYLKNRITILKYLDYYKKLYYNKLDECGNDDIWLAMLTSSSFSELYEYLEKLLPDNLRDIFIEEAIIMSKDDFVLHDWEREKMAEFEKVEARAYYKRKLKEGIEEASEKAREEAREEGLEQGLEQGLKQGIEKNTIDTIKNMLNKNYSIKTIMDITNKSEEKILEIKNNM